MVAKPTGGDPNNEAEREGEEAIWRMEEHFRQMSEQEYDTIGDEGEDQAEDEFTGDDMRIKTAATGARVATLNTYRKFMGDEVNWEIIYELMVELMIDIMVLTEPGKSDEMRTATLKDWAIEKQMTVESVNRTNTGNAGGIVVITAHAWSGVQRKVTLFAPKKAEKDRVFAIEYDNMIQGDHNKMLLIGYYGYNSSHLNKEEVREMHKFVWKLKSGFKRRCWGAPVILVGDMNAAVSSNLDTDREWVPSEDQFGEAKEPDACTIEHLESFGFHDPLRLNNLDLRIVTRRQDPLSEKKETMRYLDKILMTPELSDHLETRVGVYNPMIFGVNDTDHKMVIADVPIDVAAVAMKRADLWEVHKRVTKQWDKDELGNMAPEKIEEFNAKATSALPKTGTSASGIMKWILDAGSGTVLKTCVREYPRTFRKLKDFQTKDWVIRQNSKKLSMALTRVEQYEHPDTALSRLSKLVRVPESPHERITDEYTRMAGTSREELVAQIQETLRATGEYSGREGRKSRAAQIKENLQRRNERFADKHKKSMKAVIKSIMRRARVNEQITSQRRSSDGSIATTAKEVAKEVIAFYKNWMKSRVAWHDRWETWEGMMNLMTDQLKDRKHAEFVEGAYRESFEKYGRMQEEECIWDEIWDPIDLGWVKEGLKKFKNGKSGGPSQVTYDLLKAMDDTNLGPVVDLMMQCLKKRGLPKELNRSMIRALPKTENGLADLNFTRPVALMEALGKLFERILFIRIVRVLGRHNMIDASQHGGMCNRSTGEPLRTLAEAMEDAEESGQEFHLFSADLSKAFDTLEYWSQAMSWRALGMPVEMTEMMMNMDQEGESEVILGQGRTTSDVLGEDGWFSSGRGVRQGSIGGPIKWIVYMNFWLKYVNSKHKDEGYQMSYNEGDDTTLRSQMFVDDSNWATRTSEGMSAMIASCTQFVEFHGLGFNKKKCEYVVMNQKMNVENEWDRPTWPSGEEIVEKIRVTGDQEQRRQEAQDKWQRRANKVLHSTLFDLPPKIIGSRPQEEWTELQGELGRVTDRWKETQTTMWWAGAGRCADTEDIQEAFARGRGKDTWWEASMGECMAEEEGEMLAERWSSYQWEQIRLGTTEGSSMRYLGVWYEAGGRWKAQQQILEKQFKELNDKISRSCPTREQAIYCINATINTALKFPLQIAQIPDATLEQWDKQNRKVVRNMGYLPMATPVGLMHLPKKRGGLGLESLRQAVGRTQIANYMMLLNKDNTSLAANMTRAGRRRTMSMGGKYHGIHNAIQRQLEYRTMSITEAAEETPGSEGVRQNFIGIVEQIEIDKTTAESRMKTGTEWEAYGDGATYERRNRAGWGVWMHDGSEEREEIGRLAGRQSNDGAEARAILEAMLQVHPEDDLAIFCDNSGCISKWERLLEGHDPTTWGVRAIWLRISGLQRERGRRGSDTAVRWVHSHVDDTERAANVKSNLRCACREQGEECCDEEHRHHVGNAKADVLAGKGAEIDLTREEDRREATRGEMWHILETGDDFAQGNYGTWLREQEEARMAFEDGGSPNEEEGGEDGEHIPGWAVATRASDAKLRTSILKTLDTKGKPSWRFWSRVLCKTLPTHARMMKFANSSESNNYKTVYQGHLGEHGMCAICGADRETVEHALWECPSTERGWEDANNDLEGMWDEAGLAWSKYDWVRHPEAWEGWERMWGIAGLIPRQAFEKVTAEGLGEIGTFVLLRDTSRVILNATQRAWNARVEATLEWAKKNEEMSEAKAGMKRTAWARGAVQVRKKRVPTEEAVRKKRRKENCDLEVQKAMHRERERVIKENSERYDQGKCPISNARAVGREKAAGKLQGRRQAHLAAQITRQMSAADGTAELQTVVTDSSAQQRAQRHSSAKRSPTQRGLWFPGIKTQVNSFRQEENGEHVRGGVRGTEYKGTVTELKWTEGRNPEFKVRYAGGDERWHDSVREAGITTLRVGRRVAQEEVPDLIMNNIGHGTKVELQWASKVAGKWVESWHQGTVVAGRKGKGIAVRYGTAARPSVAWHTKEDLRNREFVITTLVRLGEYTDATYQEAGQNMKKGCLLLTDEGECECRACREKGWPVEVKAAEEMGIDVEGIREMGPREGRKAIVAASEKEKQTTSQEDSTRRAGRKLDLHKDITKQADEHALRNGNKNKRASESLAAEDAEAQRPRRSTRIREQQAQPGLEVPTQPGPEESPRPGAENAPPSGSEETTPTGDADGAGSGPGNHEDGGQANGRSRDREVGQESDRHSKRGKGDQRSAAEAYIRGDQEPCGAGRHREAPRCEGVGMACGGSGEPGGDAEAHDGMDERVDQCEGAPNKRPESGCCVGGDAWGGEDGECPGGQGGDDRGNQNMAPTERGTIGAGGPDAEDGEEGGAEDITFEPVQKDGGDRGDVRCDSGPNVRGAPGTGDGQGSRRDEGDQEEMAYDITEMGKRQRLAARHRGPVGGDSKSRGDPAHHEGSEETEGRERRSEDHGRRRRMGIHRDCSIEDAGRLLNNRSRQGAIPGPRRPTRNDHQQGESGLVLGGQQECTPQGGKTSVQNAGVIHHDMAVPRVQDIDSSERDECDKGMHQREADNGQEKHDGTGDAREKEGRAQTVPGSGGEPDAGPGRRERDDTVRPGEPRHQRPVGHPGSSRKDTEEETRMESDKGRPVRLRQEMQEANQDTDEHEDVGTEGNHGNREVRPLEVRRYQGKQTRNGARETRTANDSIRPSKKAKGGRENRAREQKGVQCASGKELGPSGPGPGDSPSGHRGGGGVEDEVMGKGHREHEKKERQGKRRARENEDRNQGNRERKVRGTEENNTEAVNRLRTGVG